MFLFGHLGIGSKLVSPFIRGLPRRALLLGTLLPDIIDKPLYYGLSYFTGKTGADLGIISGTRTFGHTAIFLILVAFVAFIKKSKVLAAVSLGIASHLILDSITSSSAMSDEITQVLLWPLESWRFPVTPYSGMADNLSIWHRPSMVWAEVIGIIILIGDEWRIRNLALFARRGTTRGRTKSRRRASHVKPNR